MDMFSGINFKGYLLVDCMDNLLVLMLQDVSVRYGDYLVYVELLLPFGNYMNENE